MTGETCSSGSETQQNTHSNSSLIRFTVSLRKEPDGTVSNVAHLNLTNSNGQAILPPHAEVKFTELHDAALSALSQLIQTASHSLAPMKVMELTLEMDLGNGT